MSDPDSKEPHGIIEVKCPYSKREMKPEEACEDPKFFCKLVDSRVTLKHTHTLSPSATSAIRGI